MSETQIKGIDIETLEFKGYNINFSFSKVENLKTAFIRSIGFLASDLPQLDTLWLSYYFDWQINVRTFYI